MGFEPAKVDLQVAQPTHEVPDARRWLWWAPTILLIGLALLFGIAAVARRERQIVRDSPAFASALRCVKPLLAAVNATPRAIKRYQNRMRYLAARLRPAAHDPDGIDSILYRVGRWIGHPLVPDIWFEERPPQAIREPALILLGAIELFAPKAFEKPAELLSTLEHGIPGDGRPKERVEVWDSVRKSFAAAHLDLPTAPEIVRYAAFVLVRERVTQSQPADIVRFPRDLGPEPQPA